MTKKIKPCLWHTTFSSTYSILWKTSEVKYTTNNFDYKEEEGVMEVFMILLIFFLFNVIWTFFSGKRKRVSDSRIDQQLRIKQTLMEQRALKNVNNCWNTNIYSYLETSGGQSSNIYLNFWTPVLIRHMQQFKTVVFLHWCLMHADCCSIHYCVYSIPNPQH